MVPFRAAPLALLLFAIPVPGQAPAGPTPTADLPAAIRQSVGVSVVDGAVVGAGPDYKVHFGPRQVTFTPVLGRLAPRSVPLGFRLESVGRGRELAGVDDAAPVADGNRVTYAHAAVTAVYDLRVDGCKQSFVFATLPPGDGDLVVRGAVGSEVAAPALDAGGARFAVDGIGGVQVGAVLGIDAVGRTCPGELRWQSGALEFVLPAAWVDGAALPLEVDPLLGTVTSFGGTNHDLDPDVAYDAATDHYLFVFERVVSASDTDIHAQRVSGAGTLVGGLINVDIGSTMAQDPCVANINLRNGFLVVWRDQQPPFNTPLLEALAIDSQNGTFFFTNPFVTSGNPITPDLAGEPVDSAPFDTAICVWEDDSTGEIKAVRLTMSTFGGVAPVGTPVVIAGGGLVATSAPAISQDSSGAGNHLLTWSSRNALTQNSNILGVVVDRGLNLLTPIATIAGSSLQETEPACDGNGVQWVVACERSRTSGTETDVVAIPVSHDLQAGTLQVGTAVDIAAGINDHSQPAVCRLQDATLVGWLEISSFTTNVRLRSVDPFSCLLCEATWTVENAILGSLHGNLAIAHRYRSLNDDNNDALLVWDLVSSSSGSGDVRFIRFTGEDGRVTSLADRCGTGGILHATCARPGNAGFAFRLRGAPANAVSFLLLSPGRIDLPCGTCLLVPDPYVGFVASFGNTSAAGAADVALALPATVSGRSLYAQWVHAGSLCFGGFDLSNAVQVRVQ